MDPRYITLCNDEQRIYRLFDTVENRILRRFRVRLTSNKIAGAANRYYALTGKAPSSWPWGPA